MKEKILFLLDYGGEKGFGHLSRCSNLAHFLGKEGIKSIIITNILSKKHNKIKLVKKFLSNFEEIIYYKKDNDNKRIDIDSDNFSSKEIEKYILIIDSYYLSEYEIQFFSKAKKLIQFKDDIKDKDYISLKNSNSKIIYFLPNNIIPKELGDLKNVFSGIHLMPLFNSEIILKRPSNFRKYNFNLFIYPSASNLINFENIFQNEFIHNKDLKLKIFMPNKLNIKGINYIDGSNGISNYLYFADAILIAGGNTMLESIFLKRKPYVFCSNKNQMSLISYFRDKDKIHFVDELESFFNLKNINKIKKSNKLNRNLNFQFKELDYDCNDLIELIKK